MRDFATVVFTYAKNKSYQEENSIGFKFETVPTRNSRIISPGSIFPM